MMSEIEFAEHYSKKRNYMQDFPRFQQALKMENSGRTGQRESDLDLDRMRGGNTAANVKILAGRLRKLQLLTMVESLKA